MSRVFTSGFEENTNTVGIEWSVVNNAGTGTTVDSTNPRTGTYAGKVVVATGDAFGWIYEFLSVASTGPYYLKFAFQYTVLPSVATVIAAMSNAITFAGIQGADSIIKLSTTGTLQLFNGASQIGSDSAALVSGTWYEIEMQWNNTPAAGSKVLEARLNQSVFATSSTITALNTNVRAFFIGANLFFEASATGTYFYDDVAFNDSTGTAQTGYPGSGKVVVLRPNATGDNNSFTVAVGGTAGSANDWTRNSEVTPDDITSYNGGVLNTDIDDFNIDNTPALLTPGSIITLVQLNVRYRAAVASLEAAFKTRIKKASGGTVASSAAITPNATTWKTNANAIPQLPPQTLYVDPDGVAWTKATLDTTQIGYNISTTNTNAADISAVWLTVEFLPAPIGKDISPGNNNFGMNAVQAVNRAGSY